MNIQFLNSIPLHVISGGNIYNKKIIGGLRQKNFEVDYNLTPSNKVYDVSIVDSLCMNNINTDQLNSSKQIISLIHQIPKLSKQAINFYASNTRFIVTSESTKQGLTKLWQVNPNHIFIIRPGILSHWKPKTIFNNNLKHVIIISNFIKYKGFEMLIHILNRLNHLELDFHIVGNNDLDKDYANKIIEAIKKTDNKVQFHFNISQEDIYKQLLQSDMFLSLSESETFGMALFEALSLGLPCLAYKTGDYGYFNTYSNYVGLNDYSTNSFLEIIEEWSNNSNIYKQYCNTSVQNKRTWNHVTEEFYESLKMNSSS